MKKQVIIPIILLLLLGVVKASDFSVTETAVQNIVTLNQPVTYMLAITNNQASSDTFKVVYPDIFWTVVSDPQSITLGPGSTGTLNLTFIPYNLTAGSYGISLYVVPSDSSKKQLTFLNAKIVSYSALVEPKFIFPSFVDTRKPTVIKLELRNKYAIQLNNVKIKIESPFFNEERTINLGQLQTDTQSYIINFKEELEKGDYPVHAILYYGENLMQDYSAPLTIGYRKDTKEIIAPESTFLINKIMISKINNGNAPVQESYTTSLTPFQKIFTKVTPVPTTISKEGGNYFYIWEFDLQPGENNVISIKTDYRTPLLYLLLIVLIIAGYYAYTKREIKLTKKVVRLINDKNNTALLKVTLIIKNKGIMNLKNVKVLDTLYHVVEHPGEFTYLHPTTTRHTNTGLQLIWDIPELNRGHTVTITYKARVRVVNGHVHIANAVAKYPIGKGSHLVHSN